MHQFKSLIVFTYAFFLVLNPSVGVAKHICVKNYTTSYVHIKVNGKTLKQIPSQGVREIDWSHFQNGNRVTASYRTCTNINAKGIETCVTPTRHLTKNHCYNISGGCPSSVTPWIHANPINCLALGCKPL